MKFVRFLIAILVLAAALPSFAGTTTVVFHRNGAIMLPNQRVDGAPVATQGRPILWEATLEVSFRVSRGSSKSERAEIRQRVEEVLGEQFRITHEGVPCYWDAKEPKWWGAHVREKLRDNKIRVTLEQVVYTCR